MQLEIGQASCLTRPAKRWAMEKDDPTTKLFGVRAGELRDRLGSLSYRRAKLQFATPYCIIPAESVFVRELVAGGGSLRQGVRQRAVGIGENHFVFCHGADGDVTGSLC